jgi:acyl dehydratase
MPKLYFEDIPVGFTWSVGEYLVKAEEIISFASIWDPYPFHTDIALAAESVFRGLTASSCHTVAICTRLFHHLEDPPAILAMLGKDRLRFPNPVRPDDRLTYQSECIEVRASSTKKDMGIVNVRDGLLNQRKQNVLTQEVSLLVARRG